MFCKNCGEKSEGVKKFCINCGAAFSMQTFSKEDIQNQPIVYPVSIWQKINTSKIVMVLVVAGFIAYGAYSNRDETSIDKNNSALTAFDSGNSTQAINQLQDASSNATGNDTKITTLTNLGYVYATEGQNEQALSSFQEALKLASQNSFDYYLLSAEIALLQGKPNSAYLSFNKAFGIRPDDFQLNNSLALFYMNIDGSSAEYENYPKALTHALKANNLNNSEVTRQNLGIAYFWNKNYDQSISILSQTNLSQHPFIGFWLGYNYAAKNDIITAKSYFRQAINAGAEAPQEVIDYLNNN